MDALAGLPAVDAAPPGPLADVGSGGGLPGSRARPWRAPTRESHLIEATARKAAFIAETAAALGVRVTRACRALGGSRPRRAARRLRLRRGARAGAAAGGGRAVPAALPAGRAPRAVVARGKQGTSWPFAAAALAGAVLAAGVPRRARRSASSRATPERFPRRPGMAAKRPLSAPRIRPTATVGSGRCRGSTQWRTRRAASARRRLRSTSPRASPRRARPVLVIDLDPQANASSGLGVARGRDALVDLRPPARRRARRHHRADAHSRAWISRRRTPIWPRRRSSCRAARTATP